MRFLDFAALLRDKASMTAFLREKGLLLREHACSSCMGTMREQALTISPDGSAFRCTSCKTRKSIRSGSVFDHMNISLEILISLVFLMSLEVSQVNLCETLGLSNSTVIFWQSEIRNAYSRHLIMIDGPLGGQGSIVEIDESVIARAKRTRNCSARPVPERWVFGLYDRQQRVGALMMVPNRSAETLVPLIQRYCAPGTTIYSDGWAAYGSLSQLGYDHRVVIHERHFVDPESGVHTNNIENYWKRCKAKFKRMSGSVSSMMSSYLDEFMWLERFGRTCSEHFNNTIERWRI
jgi:hypothetical protein